MANDDVNACKSAKLAWQVLLAVALAACSQQHDEVAQTGKNMAESKKDVAYLDVALLSYYERPIFDVYLNGHDIGVAGGPPHGGRGGGLMTGIEVTLGPQVITWRLGGPEGMPGNGDTVKAVNVPILTRPDSRFHYLGVHIYPDNTVEVIPVEHWPEQTERGEEINRQWGLKHGQ